MKDEEKCLKTKLINKFDPSLTSSISSWAIKKIMKQNQKRDFLAAKCQYLPKFCWKTLSTTSQKHSSFQMLKQKRFVTVA